MWSLVVPKHINDVHGFPVLQHVHVQFFDCCVSIPKLYHHDLYEPLGTTRHIILAERMLGKSP